VYRGVAYDLAPFLEKHPGGNWLINLALKRDCTGLFESYHLRPEVAEAPFKRLPVLADFPVEAIPRAPYPNDSELYSAIRTRVRKELFDGAKNGEHRQGSEWAACFVVGFAAAAYALYAAMPGVLTGAVLGVAGAWIGLTIQHCGNHGAMSTKPWVNNLMGWGMDLIGGSSLMWRYHHQVSHHLHCNDTDMDEDVYSSFPLMRFDARMPKYWFHNFQHIYMWAAFPLMQVAFEVGDMKAFFSKRTAGASLHGADWKEMASVIVGKVVHWGGLLAPLAWGVNGATVAAASLAYVCTQGVVLAALFAVSHNIATTKNPAWLETDELRNDWAVQQIVTSANWGSWIGCFFTGGLNLQIEHHLFPAISFMHYPLISKIAKEEATKRGVPYVEYKWLPVILGDFQKFMKEAGQAPAPPNNAYPARGGMGGDQPSPAAANIAAASSGCPIFQ
jgi:fatty acid desaturase (delta-4 desaturase)